MVISEIQRVTAFEREKEAEFIALVEKQNERVADSELRTAKVELERAKKRDVELNRIIKRIYEDNINGKLTDDRFEKMYADYENEQADIKTLIVELTAFIDKEQESTRNIGRFLGLVRKYTDVSELTAEVARIFIDKIVVYQGEGKGKFRKQQVDIYFNFIGQFKDE